LRQATVSLCGSPARGTSKDALDELETILCAEHARLNHPVDFLFDQPVDRFECRLHRPHDGARAGSA
jgi:hypothetical protein